VGGQIFFALIITRMTKISIKAIIALLTISLKITGQITNLNHLGKIYEKLILKRAWS
jgi:hypothetical protein